MSLLLIGVGRGVAASAVASFNPLTVFSHYWDASDTATLTGSPTVTAVSDKVGTWHLTSDASNGPTTGTQTLNSLNVLSFDGTEKLWHPAASGIAVSDNFEFFTLMYFDSANWTGTRSLFSLVDYSDGTPGFFVTNNGSSTTFRMGQAAIGVTSTNNAAGLPSTGWHLFRVQGIDNATLKWWVDGVELTTIPGTYTGFAGATVSVIIAAQGTGVNEVATRFAEAGLIDGGAISAPNLASLHSYLNTKYGLSLP